MEIIVNRDDIYGSLLKTQSIVEKRSTMPILSNVLLEAKEESLKIKATDLEIGIDTVNPAKVTKEGSITIPGKKLFEMIREIEAGELKLIRKDGNHLELRSGKAVFNILGLPSEDYPSFPAHSDEVFFKLPSNIIGRMVEKTIYAVSTDEIRYTLNGIFLEKTESTLRMVATDGHRLSLMDYKDKTIKGFDLGKGVIIPRKGAAELKRLIDDGAEDLMVNIKGNNGVFKAGNTILFIRMIDGDFPDYKQVLPEKGEMEAVVNKESISKALRRVSILSSEKSRGVRMSFKSEGLVVSTANPEIGEASEALDVKFTGKDIEVGFNAKYLMEVLNSVDEEEVRMEMRDELGPVQISGVDGKEHISIIMPMRL